MRTPAGEAIRVDYAGTEEPVNLPKPFVPKKPADN